MTKALVLIGGKSHRMGMEKYLMEVNGLPQYQYVYRLVTALGVDTYLSGTSTQLSGISGDYQQIVDVYDGIGPMGGLASAIKYDRMTCWLVVACDLVNLQTHTVQILLDQPSNGADIITFRDPQSTFYETTITIYRPGAFALIDKAIKEQNYSLQQILNQTQVKVVMPATVSELKNVNKPEDLE